MTRLVEREVKGEAGELVVPMSWNYKEMGA